MSKLTNVFNTIGDVSDKNAGAILGTTSAGLWTAIGTIGVAALAGAAAVPLAPVAAVALAGAAAGGVIGHQVDKRQAKKAQNTPKP